MTLRFFFLVFWAVTLLSMENVMAYQQPTEKEPEQMWQHKSVETCTYWWTNTPKRLNNLHRYWWVNGMKHNDGKRQASN